MAQPKWTLAPLTNEPASLAPPSAPGTLATYEERQIARNLNHHLVEEAAKTWETHLVGQAVDRLNTDNAVDGVTMIEQYVAINQEPRDAEAQPLVTEHLKRELNRALRDRRHTTDVGIKALHAKLAEPLTPAPRPKRFWER